MKTGITTTTVVAALAPLLLLLLTLVTTTSVYAQPVLGSIDEVTLSERIEVAETNTDIDLQLINDLVETGLEQVAILEAATTAGDDNAFSISRAQLSDTMWDIRLEISYVTPEQVELVNGLEEQDQIENRELNITFVDETASNVQENTGTLFSMYLFDDLTENNIEQIMSRLTEQLLSIRSEIIFSVPLDEVQIIGGMTVPIEELRALEAQYNPPSNLLLE
jgi:hypothetical protein